MRSLLLVISTLFCFQALAQQFCNPTGNLVIFSNYDGGILTINVDEDIPNLVIGINTYEPAQITIAGPFASNVVAVEYAGFNSNQNNNNCGQGNLATSIIGVPVSIVTINPPQNPPSVGYTPAHGNGAGDWGGIMIGSAGGCDTIADAGGVNTPDEVVYYFQNSLGGELYFHNTQYQCWQNETLSITDGGNCCIEPAQPDPGCNPDGNVVVYSNYEGGVLNINVDQDIPNLKIGVVSYEASQINITGPFAGNVTEVIYAGFDAPGGGGCGVPIAATEVNGVDPSIVTIYSGINGNIAISPYLGEPVAPGFPALVNCITGAEGECSSSNQGGGNSSQQIVQFFLNEFGPTSSLYSHTTDYSCFTGTYDVSAGGNCCLAIPTTPINPIFTGGSSYNFIQEEEISLCDGPITIDLSFYEVLFQPPTYPGYVWSDGTTGPVINITEPGTYSFTVGDYCHFEESTYLTDTVVVTACCVQPAPPSISGNTTYCINDNISSLTASSPDAGNFSWYNNLALTNIIASTAQFTPTEIAGSTTYYATIELDGCESEPTPIDVIFNSNPIVNISSTSGIDFCEGSSTTLSSTAVGTYTWSTGSNNTSVEVTVAGTYDLTVVNANGCEGTGSITISTIVNPTVEIAGNDTICSGESVTLTASGAASYIWSTGEILSTITATPESTTIYDVIGSVSECTGLASFEVVVIVPDTITAGPDFEVLPGEPFDLLVTGNYETYTWVPADFLDCSDCLNPSGTIDFPVTFTVSTESAEGCRVSDEVLVTIDNSCDDIFVPTAFTPDNSGLNDVVCVVSNCLASYTFTIFDRWGNLVFEKTDLISCWDGGKTEYYVQDGVYNWRVTGVLFDGNVIEKFGHIVILR